MRQHSVSPIPLAAASRTTTHELQVATPYRLDLTVSALRRTATNLVDVYTSDGRYLRALVGFADPVIVSVTQPRADRLAVSVTGGEVEPALASVRRMLGVERNLSTFHRRARSIPWLAPLAQRMRGLNPPRYPGLFEACANAILFQQVSLHAASAIMRRLILALGTPVEFDGVPLVVFPSVQRFLGADDAVLRGIKGIGPWTATVILLRGLGRLDVFPGGDSGVAANVALVAGGGADAAEAAETLGSQRGMLYFCLLLARLEARGEIGRASDVTG